MGSLPNLTAFGQEHHHQPRDRSDVPLRPYFDKVRNERLPTMPSQPPPSSGSGHHQHQRHSLTARKVHRTRSSGTTNHIGVDPMLEHMHAYSPISSRSHRISTAPAMPHHFQYHHTMPPLAPYQIHHQQPSSGSRRRDSINSSIGANSIRHLLTIKRSIGGGGGSNSIAGIGLVGMGSGCRHKIPLHVKAKVARNFLILCVAHALSSTILLPMFGLQAATSAWFHHDDWLRLGPNVGSLLLAVTCLISAGSALLTQRMLQHIGYKAVLLLTYATLCGFLLAHVYPSIWTLLPAYVMLGVWLAPAGVSKWNLVVFFASRISCGQQECNNTSMLGGSATMESATGSNQLMHEHSAGGRHCNRDERIRRLGRWYHAAESIGVIVGAVLAAVVMTACARRGCEMFAVRAPPVATATVASNASGDQSGWGELHVDSTPVSSTYESGYEAFAVTTPSALPAATADRQLQLDAMFNVDAHGRRVCGADACPVSVYDAYAVDVWLASSANRTTDGVVPLDSHPGATLLVLLYAGLAVGALAVTMCSSAVDNTFKRQVGGARSWTDTIMFAGPMAYFIGTEQAYMLGDFTKAFVSCSLGVQTVAGALVGMGLMQLIVACTLSMLLRHTKRYAVMAAGFFFHACLLLVLFCWKPSTDDSALFYVIAAAWGACNAVWETLLFALITLTHVGHVVAVSGRIQSLRYVGLAVTFVAHGSLCEQAKITIMFVLLCVAVVPYGLLEVRLEAQRKNHHQHTTQM